VQLRHMFERLYGPTLAPKVDRLGTYAAALGYCFVLSLIPFLLVTFTLGTKLTHLDLVQAYSDLLADILPGNLSVPHSHATEKGVEADAEAKADRARAVDFSARIMHTLERSSQGGTATKIGFLFAVYTSFNLMTQIVRTLLFIFDDHRRPLVWTWRIILKTITLFAIWMFVLLLMATCSILTPVIESLLQQLHLEPTLWTKPLLIARNLIGMAALYGAFFLTYLLVPSKSYRLRQVRNGSLVAMCGWVLCSLLFAYVLPHLWQTNSVYEALGSVVIILLWSQACAWSVIIGACWMIRFPVPARRK
jgi:YihY family inner membrane protein